MAMATGNAKDPKGKSLLDRLVPNRRLTGNILLLALAYSVNYATPLIAIPILASRVGMESYGIVALSQGVMMILVTFSDFGISFTGVKNISQSQESDERRHHYIHLLLRCKGLLAVTSFLILLPMVWIIPTWREVSGIMIASFALVLGHSFFPKWYFEGRQKMIVVALLNVVSRLTYLVALLTLVHGPSELIWVNVLNGSCWLMVSLAGWLLILFREKMRWIRISRDEIYTYLRSNWALFSSTLVDTGFRNSGIIIAGFLLHPQGLGIYGVLDKVILLLRGTFSFVYSALYPEVCTLVGSGKLFLNPFFKSALKPVGFLVVAGSIVVFFFAAPVISTMVAEISVEAIQPAIYIIALLPYLILVNLPIGLTLLATGMNTPYFQYNLVVLGSFVVLATSLGATFGMEGLVLAYLSTEFVATFYGYRHLFAEKWIAPRW